MKKKYDVYGIGNALVDIVTEVGHGFFAENNIEKGVMTLVDEKRQKALMKAIDMKKSRMSAGGSAANTVIGVNQFGGKSYYSCLVAKDDLGRFFLEDMERNGVDTNLKYEECPSGHTGRCLVMTTPDADRTMNTFLGISSFMSPSHLNEEAIKDAAYAYLEGYLVSSPSGMEALLETKRIAERNKVATALTFSDPNMLRFFSKNFEEVVGASVDLLFCNEEEALMFSETDNLKDAKNCGRRPGGLPSRWAPMGPCCSMGTPLLRLSRIRCAHWTPMGRGTCSRGHFYMASPTGTVLRKRAK